VIGGERALAVLDQARHEALLHEEARCAHAEVIEPFEDPGLDGSPPRHALLEASEGVARLQPRLLSLPEADEGAHLVARKPMGIRRSLDRSPWVCELDHVQ
jgi:hypothetical protein